MSDHILNFPLFVFLITLAIMWFSGWRGSSRRWRPVSENERQDWDIVAAASLTLLGLIIGFSFSMAVSRYDLRKSYEAEEANTISTEYDRAGLLPADDAVKVRELLRSYLDQRILAYEIRILPFDRGRVRLLAAIDRETAQLQNEMWSVVQASASAKPTPPVALVLSGMNEVLDSQGYMQAAWLNRLPVTAWVLMVVMAAFCNWLVGFGSRQPRNILLLILPLVLAIAFLLIADIDSPRAGMIRPSAEDLTALAQSLRPH